MNFWRRNLCSSTALSSLMSNLLVTFLHTRLSILGKNLLSISRKMMAMMLKMTMNEDMRIQNAALERESSNWYRQVASTPGFRTMSIPGLEY
jgi:hypothetical protein